MSGPLLALLTAVAMEPIGAAVHRFVGHGPGWVLHRDHHDPGPGALERNDIIPAVFSLLAMAAFWLGMTGDGLGWLFWVAAGVTAWGLCYAVVHDVYIHRRLAFLPRRIRWLEPLRRAHQEHHRHGGAPYGVIVPMPRRRATPARRAGRVNAR